MRRRMKKKYKYNLFLFFKTRFCKIILIFIFFTFLFYNFKKNIVNKNTNGRIFVCLIYNNEGDTIYIHIWRLYNYIDKFIIIVANKTFSGIPKNFSFSPFEKEIKKYMNKIDIVNFDNICNKKEYPFDNEIWCFEKSKRDYAKTYLEKYYNLTENDFMVIADVDEIFTREGIEYVKKNPPIDYYHVKGSMYFPYYYHKVADCDSVSVVRYQKNMKTLSKVRGNKKKTLTFNGTSKPLVTHCSYCFNDLEKYKNKIRSFSHQEFNREPYITNNWIFKSHYCREKINSPPGYDETYEGWKHLIPNDQRLKFIIDPSFEYPLNLTTYSKKDLETMCDRKYKRTPFE
jgi:hypothetical protein